MRRGGYALFVLAGLSVVIALASVGFAINGQTDGRSRYVVYGIVNFGFAVVNGALGFALLAGSRSGL
ncbi:MAG TPA: hypothetical protein VIN00_04595 [Candidatus Dormibacteraeota bacterium]|jgi:hypothetical protein